MVAAIAARMRRNDSPATRINCCSMKAPHQSAWRLPAMIVGQRRQKNVTAVSDTPLASSIGNVRRTRFSQHQDRGALDRDAGQDSRPTRPGVDVDAIVPDIGMRNRRVAMNDEVPVVRRRS